MKYKIEENIDFYSELHKMIEDESYDQNKWSDDKELCLITNDVLTENYVKLECGHTFNYLPLYKDILNHKKKFNFMESLIETLNDKQIRCPYCRTKQNSLLPFVEMTGVKKIYGVNSNEMETNNNYIGYHSGKCGYPIINMNYDESQGDIETNPKFLQCKHTYVITLKEDGKDYCVNHKYLAYKNFMKEKIKKEKEALKEKKLEEKSALKAEKIAQKKAEIEAKQEAKIKEKEKEKNNLNIILLNTVFCDAILKTGKNKGCVCSIKAVEGDNKCKRHKLSVIETNNT